ncbi:hypothetical protein GCM10009733_020720 [Nonomuraea maheshkhaliensis]|uniref:Uncharacterized protein n=1 Tax=Nonomuraea maheshkhaliensis TaxID=419590 RepID=A0ABP4QVE0_9ACTN
MSDLRNGLFVISLSGRAEADPEWSAGYAITPDRPKDACQVEIDLAAITDEQWQELQIRGGKTDGKEAFEQGLQNLLTSLGYTLLGEVDVVDLTSVEG